MYADYTLKFTDADEADGVLFDEQTALNDDIVEIVKVPKYSAVDVIGQIYRCVGETTQTDDGVNYYTSEVVESVDGWHVNVRHAGEAPELEPYRVNPKTPVRVWA